MMHSYQPMYQPYQHPPTDYYVLDLSTKPKRPASPDYTYGYPSPKSSPVSNPDFHTILSPRSPKSITSESSFSSMERSPKRKIARPFKTLAKDSIALSTGAIDQLDSTLSTASFVVDNIEMGPEETKRLMEESAKKYAEFREKMLSQLRNNTSNQNMRRMQNNKNQDPEYLEKRKKNNEAAKKSRDARRNKQDEIAIRATFLEQENMMLKFKVQAEVEDLERLRKMEV